MFTMGPKTQRKLSFSQQDYWKKYTSGSVPPVSLLKKKRFAGWLMGPCGQLGGIPVNPRAMDQATRVYPTFVEIFNRLATRRKMFTMGPKTQRKLSFSQQDYWRKSIPAARCRQYPFLKKTFRWMADGALWPTGRGSQSIHVQWIRRPEYVYIYIFYIYIYNIRE